MRAYLTKPKIYFLLVLIVSLSLVSVNNSLAEEGTNGENCRLSINSDKHVAPAAELASTQGYPDIIAMENSVVNVTSLPNRGRLAFDYYYKPIDKSLTYTNTSPMPHEMGDILFLEFGGLYATYPWNQRSSQPYNLEYEVAEDGPNCSINIKKRGGDFPFDFSSILTIKPDDPSLYVTIKLTNTTDKIQSIHWSDRLVVKAGEEFGSRSFLELPDGTQQVTVGKSDSDWMGKEGETKSWPQPWQNWSEFQGKGKFHVKLDKAQSTAIRVYYPSSRVEFVKDWDPENGYSGLEVTSWGPTYTDYLGGYPGFLVSNVIDTLRVEPGSTKTLRLEIFAAERE